MNKVGKKILFFFFFGGGTGEIPGVSLCRARSWISRALVGPSSSWLSLPSQGCWVPLIFLLHPCRIPASPVPGWLQPGQGARDGDVGRDWVSSARPEEQFDLTQELGRSQRVQTFPS